MADEALRLRAEVIDAYSGPLKALRGMLLDAGRDGAQHGETLAKGIGKAEAALQSTAKSAKTLLNPALAMLGVTGLGAGVAVAGISHALNSLVGNLSGLGQLSRETGMAAEQLRVFQAVSGKFGISGEQSASAAQTFSKNMRDIRRGVGDTMGFLLSQSPAVAQFAAKLKATTSNDEALKATEDFLEKIPDAVDRGRLAEKLLGSADFGRLGDKHLGSIATLRNKMQDKLGPLPEGAVEQAERYERAIASLRSSMQKVGTTIALQILPAAEGFTTWLDDIASGKRKELIDGLRRGMSDIGAELAKIDWKAAGRAAEDMLTATASFVKPVADSIRGLAEAIRAFNAGKPLEALRHLDGGSGSLARKLAPLPGDDQIERNEQADALRGKIGAATEQGALQADLLKELEERGDKDGAKRLREAMDANSRHLKELESALQKLIEQGATVSKSSAEGDGLFGGARIQTAAFGGGGFRRLGGMGGGGASLPGGGSEPGYAGEQGERGAMRERFREHLKRTVPGYDGGDTVPIGPGGRIPPMPEGAGRSAKGALAANQQEAYAAARAEGLSDTAARALVANMSGESLRNPRDHHWDRKHMSQGIVQWDPQRAEAIRRKFGAYPKDMSVTDQTRAAIDEIRTNPRFRRTARALEGSDPNAMLGALVENYEAPQDTRKTLADRQQFYRGFNPKAASAGDAPAARMPSAADGDFFPNGAPRVLKPNSMKDAPGITMDEANRRRSGRADGEGWAAREKARKEFEAKMRAGELRLDRSVGRAGVVGGSKVDVNGSMVVNVLKPGPDTQVRTSASGNLFKDVVTQRGRPMARAEGG